MNYFTYLHIHDKNMDLIDLCERTPSFSIHKHLPQYFVNFSTGIVNGQDSLSASLNLSFLILFTY